MPTPHDSSVPLSLAAHQLGLSWAQAWRLVLQGELKGEQRNGRWYVAADEIRRFRAAKCGTGA